MGDRLDIHVMRGSSGGSGCYIESINTSGNTSTKLPSISLDATCAQPFTAVFVKGGSDFLFSHTYT
jgi:hypothetical protein